MSNILIYTDGGSRGNPGESAYGYVVYKDHSLIYKMGQRLGITTNNVAEYMAILESLNWVKDHRESLGEFSEIEMRMDSLLACQQLKGIFKVKKTHLQELLFSVRKTISQLDCKMKFVHVPREQNKEADAMVNTALDNLV